MLFLLYAMIPFALDTFFGLLFMGRDLKTSSSRYVIALSSGLVVGAAFFELMPEANMELNAPLIGLGFFAFYLIEKATMLHACGEEECEVHTLGRLTAFGMAADNLIDGIGIAVGYLINPFLGLVLTAAVVTHEVPQAVSSATILRKANRSRREVLAILGLAGVMYPVGALLSLVIPKSLYTAIIAIVAGVFMYVGAGDLLMEAHRRFNWKVIAMVLLGGLIMFMLSTLESAA